MASSSHSVFRLTGEHGEARTILHYIDTTASCRRLMDQRNRHEKEDSTAGDRLLWPRQRLWGHSPGRARMLNVTVACIVRDILKRQPGATSPASSQIFSEFVGTQPLRMPCLRSQGADKAGRCYLGSSSSISIAFSTTVAKTAWHWSASYRPRQSQAQAKLCRHRILATSTGSPEPKTHTLGKEKRP